MANEKSKSLTIDFISGAVAHRRLYGGGKGQMIAKAIGLKPGITPSVLDATAGLGKDAFVLASLGCRVTLLERHPVVYQALRDALAHAREHAQMQRDDGLVSVLDRMLLLHVDAREYLQQHTVLEQQVIYLDPMFPERKKTAAVKKDMVLMQQTVGDDPDSSELLHCALATTAHRVVVKRAKLAPPLSALQPSLVLRGTSCRFDVYPRKSLSKVQMDTIFPPKSSP